MEKETTKKITTKKTTKKTSVIISVRFPQGEAIEIEKKARETGQSVGEVVRKGYRAGLEKDELLRKIVQSINLKGDDVIKAVRNMLNTLTVEKDE